MVRDFFLGFIKIHILHHAAEDAIYGVAIMDELRRHGYDVGPGTLYPVLHSLATSRYLRRLDRVVNGKVRKYYTITPAGRQALASAKKQIRELVDEVLTESTSVRSPGRGRPPRGRRSR
jgi:DNA-binding PadR family transcriptional regulator